jgi:hypothetical protein
MKVKKFVLLIILSAVALISPGFSGSAGSQGGIYLENFENTGANLFSTWKLRGDSPSAAGKVYSIKSEGGNKYLRASTAGNPEISIQIAKEVKWNLRKYPMLSWRWKADRLPVGANEESGKANDSACGVYVVFKRKHIPLMSWDKQPINVIKYVWSSTLPAGKVIYKSPKEKMGMTYYQGIFVVQQSGRTNLGKWMTEKRNVLQDYKRFYGEYPRFDPILIAILTDSNDTNSAAEGSYDDFIISQ